MVVVLFCLFLSVLALVADYLVQGSKHKADLSVRCLMCIGCPFVVVVVMDEAMAEQNLHCHGNCIK